MKAQQESMGHQTTQLYNIAANRPAIVGANCTISLQIYEMILSNKLLIHWMTTIKNLYSHQNIAQTQINRGNNVIRSD